MGADHQIAPPVIFFDGVCNLCNASVQFIIKRDSRSKYQFASLQSNSAQQRLSRHGVSPIPSESLLLLENGRLLKKSNAVLEIARNLDGLWPLFYIFKVIPQGFRDWLYDKIALSRYRLFGKQQQCMLPDTALKPRFLD